MKIQTYIRNIITENQNQKFWYHGTPDAKFIESAGGFGEREHSIEIVANPHKFQQIRDEIDNARANGDEKLYFKLLDEVPKTKAHIKVKSPIFFSDVKSVAATYADEKRAFDYQNAQSKIYTATINDSESKVLTVTAIGERFRGLPIENVKSAFTNAGISEDVIEKSFDAFQLQINRGRISTDALAAMAQQLGFDIIDVVGVLDSYHGGTTKSTVRIVFNPNLIKIVK